MIIQGIYGKLMILANGLYSNGLSNCIPNCGKLMADLEVPYFQTDPFSHSNETETLCDIGQEIERCGGIDLEI